MLGGVVVYGDNHRTPTPTRLAHPAYTTDEVYEFILLSQGRIAAEHPGVLTTTGPPAGARPLPATKVRTALQTVRQCIDRLDGSLSPALTTAVNTADPQRLDNALQRFDAAAVAWMTAPQSQNGPCPPPPPPPSAPPKTGSGGGWWHLKGFGLLNYVGIGNYVVLGDNFFVGYLTVGIAAAISAVLFVAALVAVWVVFVPILLSYDFENTPTELDRQTAIAKIAHALRS